MPILNRVTGRPLDAAAAAERARQVAALVDPVRLRLLSLLVSDGADGRGADAATEWLQIPRDDASMHLQVLMDVGLISAVPGAQEPLYLAAPDAWLRFGRILALPDTGGQPLTSTVTDLDRVPPELQRVAERLAYRYSSFFSRETVDKYVTDSYRLLRQRARVAKHLPSLTSRLAIDRLSALATAQGMTVSGTPEVLFVCVHNAGRSQIAAGLLRQLAGERVHVRTAGSHPIEAVDQTVIEVLEEVGVPVVSEFPKPLTDEVVQAADVVVTMGCGDACPVYPGRRYMDWQIPDPLGLPIEEVRVIRDEIQRRLIALLESLGFPAAPMDPSTR